jgi:DNA polymerase III alpha subunit (gram-positive type)
MKMLIYYDLETTGLSPTRDEMIQIGAINLDTGDTFNECIKPIQEVTNWQYHGVKPEQLATASSLSHVAKRFNAWLEQFEDPLLVAHNGFRFDMQFLVKILTRSYRHSDSYVALKAFGGHQSYALRNLYKDLITEKVQEHTALEDCEMLRDIVKASKHPVVKKLLELGRDSHTSPAVGTSGTASSLIA